MATKKEISSENDINLTLSEFRQILFDRVVPVRDLLDKNGEDFSKVIAYWRRHDLLPFVPDGKKMDISFAQLIWLRILDDLREIAFPLSKMKTVCDYFFKDAYFDNLPKKSLQYNREQIKKRFVTGTQTEEDELLLENIEIALKHEKALQILNHDVNYLSKLLVTSIAHGVEGLIYVFFDGAVFEFAGNSYVGHNRNNFNRTAPHICLKLTHYLQEFIISEELSKLFLPQILNDDELKVMLEMRRKNIKQINIVMNNDAKPRIESTTTGTMTAQQSNEIKKILGLQNYDQITLYTMDEKTLSFKRTRKRI